MNKKNRNKHDLRLRRAIRFRSQCVGTKNRPRLCVHKSNKKLYVQIVDDEKNSTLKSFFIKGTKIEQANKLGDKVVSELKKKKIKKLVFDRSGYKYHGAVKAIAESIREGGITI